MNISPILARLDSEICACHPARITALVAAIRQHAVDIQAAEHPNVKALRERLKPSADVTPDGIAIIPVNGVLAQRPDIVELLYYGAEDTSAIQDMVKSASADNAVKGILLKVDSPGGFITGGPETADAVAKAASRKPTVAFTDGMMASLAYWIGSQASAVIATRSASVGSIGVFAAHIDATEFHKAIGMKVEITRNTGGDLKAAGAFGTSMTEAQRADIQAGVDSTFAAFAKDVRRTRQDVSADSMRGQVFDGPDAKKAGLIDAVGSLSYALSRLRGMIG